ncbi:hypothetical protein Vretimale_1964 [Volvox reticuliferus]|uniref:Uncharacterized protein n=2 Tax=Volvox reticuliferus TaxID=1737510 RepID=A0A8J4FZY1_9CHLO|nr:hypothetical protein Vretifemale_4227 [Volvox reticuliferus]GIL96077.1 hypothetical protein Vretimale_1964 [Volvox reticuliferus]
MADGPCGAINMYVDLPLPYDLVALGTRRHSQPEVIQSLADTNHPSCTGPNPMSQTAAGCNLDNWLTQQRSADPAECWDDDCALTTSSMTIADEHTRHLLYAEPFSSPARPSASDIAAAMAAAGTLSGSARLSLSCKDHRRRKRSQSPFLSARPHETLPHRQLAGGGTGASARSTSPGWDWPATALTESSQAPAISTGVPISVVAAGASSTFKSRVRASPLHRSNSRRSNVALKNSGDAIAMLTPPWSGGSDVWHSSTAKLATVTATRGPVFCGAAAPRARSTGRQRKNLLDELKNPSQTPRAVAAAPLTAGRHHPSPSRRVYAKTSAPHDVVCSFRGLAGDGSASRSISPSARNLHAPPVCPSSMAVTTKAASSRESAVRDVAPPACSSDPRLMSLRGLTAELPSLKDEASEKAGDLDATRPSTAVLVRPATTLGTQLATSLAAADGGSGSAASDFSRGIHTDAVLNQRSNYTTGSGVRIENVQYDPVVTKSVNPCPEPGCLEVGNLGAPGSGARAVAATAVAASPQACTLGGLESKGALVPAPSDGALLVDPGFVAVLGVMEPSHDGQAAAAPNPASRSANHCTRNYNLDPAQVRTFVPQKEGTMISTVEPLSPTITAAITPAVIAKSLPKSPRREATAQLLAINDLDAHGSAPDGLIRQLVAIVQSQAAQIKDLHDCLAAERVDGVPNASPRHCERGSSEARVTALPPLGKLEGQKGLAPAGGAAGRNGGKEPDGRTRSAAVQSSVGQLVALSSSSTQYHDSVGSMRSSREVPESSVAVDENQDGGEGVRRESMPGCGASLSLREHIQRDDADGGSTPAGAAEWHVSAGYDAGGAGSFAPVVIDGWWISYGCSSRAGEFAGVHQSSHLAPDIATALGAGGLARGVIGGRQGMPLLSPNGEACDVRASAGSGPQEAGKHCREDDEHRHSQQQRQQQQEQPAQQQCLAEQQQLRRQQQMQPQPSGVCQDCEHDLHAQCQGSSLEQDRTAAHYGQRRARTQTLESYSRPIQSHSRDGPLSSSDEAPHGNRGHQVQRNSAYQDQRTERQMQHQEQEQGPRSRQSARVRTQLRPSWGVVAEASLCSEVKELWQRLAQLEAAATQQQQLLYKGNQRDQNQQEPNQKPQGQEQWQEWRYQQQDGASGATAHCMNHEMQSSPKCDLQTGQVQQRELSSCDVELGRKAQEQGLWLRSLPDQVGSMQQELRRQEKGKLEALEQVANGLEHVAPCMRSAILPQLGAAATAAAASQTPLPSDSARELLPPASSTESVSMSGASSPKLAAASAAFGPRSVASAAIATAVATGSSSHRGARTPSGGSADEQPGSALPYDIRRQLRALQQEMRHMQAVMAGHVFTAAAAGGGAGGGKPGHVARQCEVLPPEAAGVSSSLAGSALGRSCASSLQLHSQRDWEVHKQHQIWQEELQQQVHQLRQEVSELRNSEALIVEAQEALMDLINDMRRDLDEVRNMPYPGLTTPRAGCANGASRQRSHAARSAIDASPLNRKWDSDLPQELGSAAMVDFNLQEVEQVQNGQSGSRQALQPQADQVSEMVAVIQSVNSMLNGSLLQAMSKIQAQGEEIEELKRCMARVAGGQACL